jgi:hypothetical protein
MPSASEDFNQKHLLNQLKKLEQDRYFQVSSVADYSTK